MVSRLASHVPTRHVRGLTPVVTATATSVRRAGTRAPRPRAHAWPKRPRPGSDPGLSTTITFALSESDRERTPEEEYSREPYVLEDEDDIPRQPSPPFDPYTPEPGARPGERRAFNAMWLAVAVIAIVVAIVIYAAVR